MAASVSVQQPTKQAAGRHGWFRARRWWVFCVIGLLVAALVYVTLLILNWPFTEQPLIDVLQERSVRSVTIDHFYRTYWPPGCVAEGISFLHRKHKEKAPLITIRKLIIKGSYTRLLTISRSLSKVIVVGMHVTVPPSAPNGGPNPVMPLTHTNNSGPSMVIGRVVADGAVLDFLPADRTKKPFRLTIDKLAIDGVGNNRPLAYRALISNSLPPGKIRSAGVFGPWNADNPASTPVKGSYTYQDANLAVFSGLSGTLSASGNFAGKLGQMETSGSAEVPNFQLTNTSHTRKLSTNFKATVDATHGNTTIESLTANFDSTTVFFKGTVSGLPGAKGKTVSLDMSSDNGRIEDLLDLFISAKHPPMTGSASFRAHVLVPPTAEDFVKKLQLTGDFGVGAGEFTNKETQSGINRLSNGGKENKKAGQEDAATVLSDLKGHAVAKDGVATLSHVSFRVPDATAWMHGTYGLVSPYKVDLHGHLLTQHPSNAATGFKSFLLKAMSPFLKKRQANKVVPFKITGDYQHTTTGLDM